MQAGCVQATGNAGINVIPDRAVATIDIRVAPNDRKADIKNELTRALAAFPHLSYTIEAEAAEEPETNAYKTPFYEALADTIAQRNLVAQPHYFEGATDLRFYLDRNIQGIGFTPFTVQDNIHGTNESVPLYELIRGCEIIEQFLINFCCNVSQ